MDRSALKVKQQTVDKIPYCRFGLKHEFEKKLFSRKTS